MNKEARLSLCQTRLKLCSSLFYFLSFLDERRENEDGREREERKRRQEGKRSLSMWARHARTRRG